MPRIAEAFVEITARTAGLRRRLAEAERKTKMSANRMSTSFASVKGALVGLGVLQAVSTLTKLYTAQEEAVARLEGTLSAFGNTSRSSVDVLTRQAAAIQRVTRFGDEQLLGMFAQIRALGVQERDLDRVTRAAIGLSTALELDVKSAARYVALAEQGEFTMLRRYIPALRATTDAAEQLAIVQDVAAKGFDTAKKQATTLSGSFTSMKNAAGDFIQTIQGGSGFRGITAVFSALAQTLNVVNSVISEIFHGVGNILGDLLQTAFSAFPSLLRGTNRIGESLKKWPDFVDAFIRKVREAMAWVRAFFLFLQGKGALSFAEAFAGLGQQLPGARAGISSEDLSQRGQVDTAIGSFKFAKGNIASQIDRIVAQLQEAIDELRKLNNKEGVLV